MKSLENKTAVVTGGNSGIGYATVSALVNQGARVLFTGRNEVTVAETSKQSGAVGVVSDQSDLAQIDELVKRTKHELQKVDILVVNAGTFSPALFESVTEAFYDQMMDVNLKGVYFTIQKFLPLLNDHASIVLISAAGSKSAGAKGGSVYYLSRAGINSMARTLCIELAPRHIRINAILPAAIDTPIFNKMGLPEEVLAGVMGTLKEKIPLKKLGTAADVANLVVFLGSENSSFITGAEYMMDGGLSRIAPI